ncbi:MAG TPA: hypothetical protein VE130_09380, partial [Nitrososphaeraceae archaeon]|nr:hypothetical protein [Nitrososphaeraceae archaeon]
NDTLFVLINSPARIVQRLVTYADASKDESVRFNMSTIRTEPNTYGERQAIQSELVTIIE